jgi:hypothetical protein
VGWRQGRWRPARSNARFGDTWGRWIHGRGWAAHGAYREGQLIGDILSNPQDWTVDAAGAIVPVIRELPVVPNREVAAVPDMKKSRAPQPAPSMSIDPSSSASRAALSPTTAAVPWWTQSYLGAPSAGTKSVDESGGISVVPRAPAPVPYRPGGIPAMLAAVTGGDESDPSQFQPPAGGPLGMIQDYMRAHSVEWSGSLQCNCARADERSSRVIQE